MPYPAKTVANSFLRLAQREGRQLTNMQLQKLVFIAHGFFMAFKDGEPLVDETAKAWQWGPVFPKLYKKFMQFGSGPITEIPTDDESIPAAAPEFSLIEKVWKSYGKFTGSQLSNITHKPDAPWSVTWKEKEFSVIDNAVIANYYRGLLAANA